MPLLEYMTEASKARADNMAGKERDIYRSAARAYPTAKEPWSRLAESYFEEGDYGNAILAAQEVLQRDAADPMATSVLAVSGLRVSTQALSALRTQNSKLPNDSRLQAEGLTKTLRELLGEPVLVPPAGKNTAAPASSSRRAASRQAVPKQPATGATPSTAAPTSTAAPAATSAKPAAPASSPSKPVAPKSPFDALK
ncbi:tetratricopeptide repeat protein [Rubrivivax gelatinosus]|uniref:Tetratricopeptide repeat protein n=1 Tax=Rubrivivax gelatinosus TaxID=28068 RepID=A0ABS1DWC5_RUBGE|nr:hypothetical protein [Rubrivivax gelatinosus]MBK1714336.1 hypothetical protein [Rubrivivax gelatinosus]